MAGLNRRFSLAVVLLPLLFLVMSGLARANDIVVNTLSGESALAPLCSLPDAVVAHNTLAIVNGCAKGSGNDRIFFDVTGTITIDEPLEITSGTLSINGPIFGCAGPGPCGITIDGGGSVQIIRAESGTSLTLNTLTLAHGFGVTTSVVNTGGGAVFAVGNSLKINDCLLRNNRVAGSNATIGGEGGAVYAGVTGLVTIVNSTFANNTAVHGTSLSSEGGAISAEGDTLKVTNATISGNSADSGGGINFGTTKILKNTILSNNTGGNCAGGTPTDLGANISDDGTCGFSVSPSLNNTNPRLLSLANNGGPTDTFALETTPIFSPAINRVSLSHCTDQSTPTPLPLDTDQRLFSRPDPLNFNFCDSGAYEVGGVAPYTLNSERVQVATSGSSNSDKVNIGMTFTANGDPDCDLGPSGDEDALNFGVGVALVQGTCGMLPDSGLFVTLFPFVVHTINGQSYGTLFQSFGSETVSARMVALKPPTNSCGKWTLNLEVAGLNTGGLGLGGPNPYSLLISDFVDAEACFDINNAIVGSQIPTPGHGVRRGTRR
jgi:hypothetical protein